LLDTSFSRAAGGSPRTSLSSGRSASSSWGRGASSGFGSRGEAAARYGQQPGLFQGSEMPGRSGGSWPHVPSGRNTGADLGADAGDGPDLGIAASEGDGRTSRQSTPARRPSGVNGRAGTGARAETRQAQFGRGQRVKHLDYGEGTVIASSVLGSEELVLVRFDNRPDKPKNLSLSIHRLEPS
jgi:hypothetical protein